MINYQHGGSHTNRRETKNTIKKTLDYLNYCLVTERNNNQPKLFIYRTNKFVVTCELKLMYVYMQQHPTNSKSMTLHKHL